MRKYCAGAAQAYKLKRYNSLTFASYEEARKYTRRLVTKLAGGYKDGYSDMFKIVAITPKNVKV
jgi:hypothetical protein